MFLVKVIGKKDECCDEGIVISILIANGNIHCTL